MKVFFNALIVHLIFNIYVYLRGWQILPPKKSYKYLYTLLFAFELIMYFIGYLFWDKLPDAILRPITLIGTTWMVLIGYFTAFLLLYDAVRILKKKINKEKTSRLETLKTKRTYFITTLSIVIVAMSYGNYRFKNPVVTTLNLTVDKKNTPLDSLKIVMAADIHVGTLINREMLKMYVDEIMAQKPDLILLVGDIIDYDLPPLVEQQMDEEFRRLKAPYGVYASTGNHEYRLNAEEKIAWLSQKAGLTVLRDTVVKVADSFYLVGREDDLAPKRKTLPQILNGVDRSLPVIVMNHEPHKLKEESDQQVDLALYGHTHNGQLFPYNIVINWIYEVGHGYKKKDNTHIYVTSGLGLAGPEYRIGTISEFAVINIKFR